MKVETLSYKGVIDLVRVANRGQGGVDFSMPTRVKGKNTHAGPRWKGNLADKKYLWSDYVVNSRAGGFSPEG